MVARLLSVNIGRPVPTPWPGEGRTAINKTCVSGAVRVHSLGIAGDEVADRDNHGGTDMAVYAFAREDLDDWSRRLGRDIRNGQFGENLTTVGIDVNAALIGERWRIGSAMFEVSMVRIPCSVFSRWMGVSGFDNDKWVKRFTELGRPGPYLRVIEPGSVEAGDEISVIHKPGHAISVSVMFKALTTRRELLPSLLEVGDGLASSVRQAVESYAAHA